MLAYEHPGRRAGLRSKPFWWIMVSVSERNVVHRSVTWEPAAFAPSPLACLAAPFGSAHLRCSWWQARIRV